MPQPHDRDFKGPVGGGATHRMSLAYIRDSAMLNLTYNKLPSKPLTKRTQTMENYNTKQREIYVPHSWRDQRSSWNGPDRPWPAVLVPEIEPTFFLAVKFESFVVSRLEREEGDGDVSRVSLPLQEWSVYAGSMFRVRDAIWWCPCRLFHNRRFHKRGWLFGLRSRKADQFDILGPESLEGQSQSRRLAGRAPVMTSSF